MILLLLREATWTLLLIAQQANELQVHISLSLLPKIHVMMHGHPGGAAHIVV